MLSCNQYQAYSQQFPNTQQNFNINLTIPSTSIQKPSLNPLIMQTLPLNHDSEGECSDVKPSKIHELQTVKTNKKRKRNSKSPKGY